jgi:hypothetical protein
MRINLLGWFSAVSLGLGAFACSAGGAASSAGPPAYRSDGPVSDDGGIGMNDSLDAPATSLGGSNSVDARSPGLYVVDAATPGSNACAGQTLKDVLVAIRAAQPALADIVTIYNPAQQGSSDGNFIYPYQQSDGGFAVTFKRGQGDCPAGCTDNTYDYFQTDANCAPMAIGHYRAISGSCLQVQGDPMWGHPAPPPDPSMVCGADNTPRNISGTFTFRAQGQSQPCATGWDKANANTLDATITVLVGQNGADLANGTVIVQGTGSALIDGVHLPARFIRQRFEATLQKSNVPSNCPQESSVSVQFDFENALPGTLTMSQSSDANCSACKGALSATLTLTSAL